MVALLASRVCRKSAAIDVSVANGPHGVTTAARNLCCLGTVVF